MLNSIILSVAMSLSSPTVADSNSLDTINIDDGFLSTVVERKRGDLRIERKRGDLRIERKRGDLRIERKRGDLRIERKRGDLRIERKRGDLRINEQHSLVE